MVVVNTSIGGATTSVSGSTGAGVTIVLTVDPTNYFAAGQYCTVAGVVGNTNANGDKLIAAATPTTITLSGALGNGAYVGGGTVSRKYGTMQAWELATDLNLVSLTEQHVGHCYQDLTTDFALSEVNSPITLDGSTTNATYYRELRAGVGHRWNPRLRTGVCIKKMLGAGSGAALILDENFARITGIGVEIIEGPATVSSGSYTAVQIKGNDCILNAVTSKFTVGEGTSACVCFSDMALGLRAKLYNCLAIGADEDTIGAYEGYEFTNAATFYNSDAFGCRATLASSDSFGFNVASGSTIRNCIAINCVNDIGVSADFFTTGALSFTNCISSDDSAASSTSGFGGQTSGQVFYYAEADDFRLAPTSAGKDTGVTLSTSFTTDIDDTVRSGFWEIGCYANFVATVLAAPTIIEHTIGSGVGRDYATLALWETATKLHLIAANVRYRGIVYADSVFALGAATLTIDGAVSDSLRYRELVAADDSRFDAAAQSGVQITGTASQVVLVKEKNFRMSGVSIANTSAGTARVALQLNGSACIIDSCYLSVLASTGAGGAACLYGFHGTDQTVRNCIAVGAGSAAGANYGVRMETEDAVVENCTAALIVGFGSNGIGFKIGKATGRATNCIAIDCVTDFSVAATSLCDYCLSSDATAPGPNSIINKTSSQVFLGGGDYRLSPGSAALNVGLSLSLSFSTDFDGATRLVPWEMGAYDGYSGKSAVAPSQIEKSGHLCRTFLIERVDGVTLEFTDSTSPFYLLESLYEPAGGLDSSASRHVSALRDNNMEFRGALTSDAITFDDLYAKKYNGAKVTISLVDWRFPFASAIEKNVYYIRSIEFSNEEWIADIAGLTQRLSQEVGENAARDCSASLGDSKCKVDVSSYSAYGQSVTTVVGIDNTFRASAASGTYIDEWFRFGRVIWLTGNNAGTESEVLSYTQATREWQIQEPTPFDIQVGDTFDAIVGCDGRRGVCNSKFANLVNFRGEPFSPGTDRMIKSPQ